jgi:hypothetical protein
MACCARRGRNGHCMFLFSSYKWRIRKGGIFFLKPHQFLFPVCVRVFLGGVVFLDAGELSNPGVDWNTVQGRPWTLVRR